MAININNEDNEVTVIESNSSTYIVREDLIQTNSFHDKADINGNGVITHDELIKYFITTSTEAGHFRTQSNAEDVKWAEEQIQKMIKKHMLKAN